MSFEPRDYLRHMLVEADYLIGQAAGLGLEAFLADETRRRAFVRSLEIIGEAARRFQKPSGPITHSCSGVRWGACETG